MNSKEAIFKKYIMDYDLEVPEEKIQQEYEFIRADMRHRMQYGQMTGESFHLFPEMELREREEELRELALFEAKSELVLKELMKNPEFDVTQEELNKEGERLAKEEGTHLDMIKRFFGDDLKGLERDVKERKIKEWIESNYSLS